MAVGRGVWADATATATKADANATTVSLSSRVMGHSRFPGPIVPRKMARVCSGQNTDGCTVAKGQMLLWYSFYTIMDFEFDPAKSVANLAKHGIDFVAAQPIWDDPDRLEIPARSEDEPRTQVVGLVGPAVWSAFVTIRNDRIRMISVRRARHEEEAAYREI